MPAFTPSSWNKAVMLRVSVFAVLAVLSVVGCGDSGSPNNTGTSTPPATAAPKGPHGGQIVRLEPDKVSAEYVYDASANKVRVYLDGPTAEKATAVTMESLAKEAEVEVFPFKKAGDAWESEDAAAVKYLRQGQSGKVTLTVKLDGDKSLSTWSYLSLP